MTTSLSLPSGATLQTILLDLEALAQAPIEALLPADVASIVGAAEKLVNRFVSQLVNPDPNNVLGAMVDAEQTAAGLAADKEYGPAK